VTQQTSSASDRPLRVAMLAPPWIPVPPPAYGGIEAVIAMLSDALVAQGHSVTLFAAPGSRSRADVLVPLEEAHPDDIGFSLYEADHVATAFDAIDAAAGDGEPFDVVHDHTPFTAFAMADRLDTPLIHTLHGPFLPEISDFYDRHSAKAMVVALSEAQRADGPPSLHVAGVVPNPVAASEWPLAERKGEHLLWVGRLNDDKGPHRAIEAARLAGRPLVIAGPVQPGEEEYFDSQVAPHIDDDGVRYIGEIGGADKQRHFAEAAALLMPIRWPEPFGMVMVEAMICGTPVIAYPEGAAKEVVREGETGFLVGDEQAMAAAVSRLGEIDPARCREVTADRFDSAHVASAYAAAYRRAIFEAR
jgi:glycosyltransferase involved in cell wall biosynthesis